MQSLADVMRDLELVLLQASMSETAGRASLPQLQRLIRRRDLLTKMERGGATLSWRLVRPVGVGLPDS